jgi:hypothetical protein
LPSFDGYPLLPGAAVEGFAYGTITKLEQGAGRGAGFLQGPDGFRAGLQWELADTPFIMKVESPDRHCWGVYRVGFLQPVATADDVVENLRPLLQRLRVLYARARIN